MARRRPVAVVGVGRLGCVCATLLAQEPALALAGVVRRPESVDAPLPPPLDRVPVAAHIAELGAVEAALICLPAPLVAGAAEELLQERIAVVECAQVHGREARARQGRLARVAEHHRSAAIVGAGWDPGLLSLLRGLFALAIPRGHSEARARPGAGLHHSEAARAIDGVRDALCTELRSAGRGAQRYVYVELEPGAEAAEVERALKADPLFLGEETLLFTVDSVAALEDEHGAFLERRATGGAEHERLLLEARFDTPRLAARVMVAAARALSACRHGAWSLFELPPAALWGEGRTPPWREWI